MSQQNDDLAYGRYYDSSRGSGDTSRGLGDTFKKLRDTYKTHSSSSQPAGQPGQSGQPYNQSYNQQSNPSSGQPGPQGQSYQDQNQSSQYGYSSQTPNPQYQQPHQGQQRKDDKLSGFLNKIQGTVTEYGSEWATKVGTAIDPQAYAQYGHNKPTAQHRFDSFAPPREHNDAKWYVDGCSYFWAVSRALETARESIWILDWWLSPELYLRRPPTKNENYRLDRMLQAAAQRGVRVNIIVYKEVTQALTLSSAHTKHALEALHPNIAVFRHPDHLPDGHEVASEIASAFQHLSLNSTSLAQMSKDNLKGVYGATDEMILYWAHHEKLCLIDGRTAFMGGLDLCFGRWDTHQHAIADVHPEDINETVFPGQDYNNSRVLDFHNVAQWENNQLDRRVSSRMGWSDISLSLHGPVVEDLRRHFLERWNFIYDAKYQSRNDSRYARLGLHGQPSSQQGGAQQANTNLYPSGQGSPMTQQPSQQNTSAQTGNTQSQPSWQTGPAHSSTSQSSVSPQPQQQTQTYPPPGQSSDQSQSQQSNTPSWQTGAGAAAGLASASSQPQYQQHEQQAQSPAGQGYQPSAYPPHPSQSTEQSQHQQGSAPDWQSSGKTDYSSQAVNRPPSNPQDPPPAYSTGIQDQGHGSHQYSYTGDSFPPPPPGPPPVQSAGNSPHPSQQQGQQGHGSYYAQTPSNISELPAQTSENYAPYDQYQSQPSYHQQPSTQTSGNQNQPQAQSSYYPPPPSQESHSSTRGIGGPGGQQNDGQRGFVPKRFEDKFNQYVNPLRGQLAGQIHQYQDRMSTFGQPASQTQGHMSCQVVRSCAKWSNGSPLEHSIQNAYAAVIKNSLHFVYIENQFFITATGDHQHPVKNTIGAAILERILRAARAGEKFKIIVVIPSVPCFAGDLHDDETLGTRAIMEFQYNSINRGGNSIMELIAKEGYNPMEYIRFYNLRNYDRINNGNIMATAEQQSGVNYGAASQQYDQHAVAPVPTANYGQQGATRSVFDPTAPFDQYQQAAHKAPESQAAGARRWDSVSSCYMLGGEDIRNVPWNGHPEAEIDAFVSEELYVHSKVMIADDRVVICGSANLNDRSQLGDHDSEIAVIIEDFTPIQSTMNGKPWTASRFASSLRRELMRKHLGLLPPQDYQHPDGSFEPVGVPIQFDFDCPESKIVADPLSDGMQSLWNSRARTNTEVFRKVFHAVPDDNIRNWATYKEFYEYYFHDADREAEGQQGFGRPARYQWGHVVRDDFAPGPEGAKQVKELLSKVKGTLVEMPLMFLGEEDVAKTGLTLNELTEPIYT